MKEHFQYLMPNAYIYIILITDLPTARITEELISWYNNYIRSYTEKKPWTNLLKLVLIVIMKQ